MRPSLPRLKVIANQFGTYELIHPPPAPSKHLIHLPRRYHPPLDVPPHIDRPSYVPRNWFTRRKADEKIEQGQEEGTEEARIALGGEEERGVRQAGRLVAEVMSLVEPMIQPGTTTAQIDAAIHDLIVQRDAYPSPLGYHGFPKSVTSSVNNVICHGIPDDRSLLPSDILNIDITLFTRSHYHGDTSLTFALPSADIFSRALIAVAREALHVGIRACAPGRPFKHVGDAIDEFVREEGFSVNRQFTGHGVGKRFHSQPWLLHHHNDEPGIMLPGHCFTIEPCIVEGDDSDGFLWPDGWTMATRSGARSAQFEHMVLITENGAEVLTQRKGNTTTTETKDED